MGSNAISVISLQTKVTVIAASATVSPTTTYYYSLKLLMPQTDTSALPVYYGSLYAPYASTIASCSSILSLFNIAATGQSIMLSNLSVRAIALSFMCELSWSASFTRSRSALLSGQKIVIQLTNAITSG